MICLNPVYCSRKYLKGYFRLEDSDFFGINMLNIRCIFDTKNNIVSKIKFNYMTNILNELPDYIINQLVKYDVRIVFIDNSKMFSLIKEHNILGLYLNNGLNQVIYINSSQPFYSLKNSLYHEIGHFIDKCMGDFFGKSDLNSFTDDIFLSYLEGEISSLRDVYFNCNIAEVFAQIFSELMQDNKELISFAPKSCSHIVRQLRLLK